MATIPRRPGQITALLVVAIVCVAVFSVPSSPRRQFEHARKLEDAGNYSSALDSYRRLLKRIPATQPDAMSQTQYRIGECLWQLDRPNEALRAFEDAVARNGLNLGARLRVGEIYLAGGIPQRAVEQAAFVAAQQTGNADAYTLLGSAYEALGQNQLAASFLARALTADPTRANVAIDLADLYARNSNVEQAREVLQVSIQTNPKNSGLLLALGRLEEREGNLPAAEESYRAAVAASDSPETNLRLAQFLQRSSRITEAEIVLKRVDRHNPTQPSALADFEMAAGRPSTAAVRYTRELTGVAVESSPAPREAFAPASKIAARLVEADLAESNNSKPASDPGSPADRARVHLNQYRQELDSVTIHVLEAEIALAQGNTTEAQVQAGNAVSKAPQSAAAHYILGVARYAEGDKASARSEWQSSIDNDPEFLPARVALGRVAFESGDTAAAEDQFVFVLREEPANLRALTLYARSLAGGRHYAPAAMIARRAATLDPSSAEPQVILGDIALRVGHPAEALVDFEKALLLEPQAQGAIDGLIRVYRSGKVTKPMLARMEAVAGHEPASATLFELVGRLYADHGWYPDAIRAFQRSLELEPRRTTARSALARAFTAVGKKAAAETSARNTGNASAEVLAGVDAQKRNDMRAAIQHYETALWVGDRSGIAANNLAWIYAQQETLLERALLLARTARDTAPENASFLDTLGYVHLRRREYSEAVDTLKRAVTLASLHPSSRDDLPQLRGHLAEAYRLSGQPEAAEKLTSR